MKLCQMDSRKLANKAQLTQYGGSKAKVAIQGEAQNVAFGKQERELGSSHHGLAVVPSMDYGGLPRSVCGGLHGRGSPFPLEFIVFFSDFSGAMQFQPF